MAGSLPAGVVSAFTCWCIWGGDATWGWHRPRWHGSTTAALTGDEGAEDGGQGILQPSTAPRCRPGPPAAALPAPVPPPATMAAGLPLTIWTAVLFLWQHFSRNASEGAWCCVKTREAASPTLSPAKGSEKRPRHLSCLPPQLLPSPASSTSTGAMSCRPRPVYLAAACSPASIFTLPSPLTRSLSAPGHSICQQPA